MDKIELMAEIKDWLDKAPTFADFGFVEDIESSDNVVQIFY